MSILSQNTVRLEHTAVRRANPVFSNFLLESALLPRTRYHVHERVALSRVRLLNTRELFSTVCLLTVRLIQPAFSVQALPL